MTSDIRACADEQRAVSRRLRALADQAGRGPQGLILNALATQAAVLECAIQGAASIYSEGAAGVGQKPTDGGK